MIKSIINTTICFFMMLILTLSAVPSFVSAKSEHDIEQSKTYSYTASNTEYYRYLKVNDFEYAKKDILIKANDFRMSEDSIFTLRKAEKDEKANYPYALDWKEKGYLSIDVDIPKDALYNIELSYYFKDRGIDPNIGLKIDNNYPFSNLKEIKLSRFYKNKTEKFDKDEVGNELSPEQIDLSFFKSSKLNDKNGAIVGDYLFALKSGKHNLQISSPNVQIVIESIALTAPEELSEYNNNSKITDAGNIIIEGEDAIFKSSNTFVPKADTSNAYMSPSSATISKINYIGGSVWKNPGDNIEWSFNAEKSGYYSLGFRYKQSDNINGESFRWLKIDGKTPFKEASSIEFAYAPKWSFCEFSNSRDIPYYVYLEEGEHTLSLSVTMNEMSEFYSRLSQITNGIGNTYIDIVKITGDTPDPNLDYELFKQIPNLNKDLELYSDSLKDLIKDMQSFTGQRGSQYIASMKNMKRILDIMIKRPYTAHQYVNDFYTNYSTLSSWIYDMKSMPIYLDAIELCAKGNNYTINGSNTMRSLAFGAKRFLYSFTLDYHQINKKDNNESLTLWVNWGRDQATVLDTIIKEYFTADTGIDVRLKQVNASLINGLLAGNYPDLLLNLSRTDPVNLGIRGALTDLSKFNDYKDVMTRFSDGAEIPYTYNGATYALPDTENFYIMFYRKDILDNMGLSVPKTWKEFLETATVIQQNNMQVYIPYTQITTATTVNAGIGSLNIFPTLMLQNGLSLYNEDKSAVNLTNTDAISVFEDWTNLYKEYQFLKEADFYNRFRVGTMPIGIAPYSTYLSLADAAPEIKNRWAMANVPGNENGNSYIAGSGTGCAIVKKSMHQEAAWKFLKWWTSAETQIRYATYVESVIGVLGRPQTSNLEAFKNLAWDTYDKEAIINQWKQVKEIPEVPGSYYLTRAVDQAFWSVVNGESKSKDALVKWSRVANNEIKRKISEYAK